MKMIFLGPPGAGKGTIASLAKEFYKIPHISTGDLFRHHIKNKTELGKQVSEIIAKGNLVPDSITIEIVKNRIAEDDCKNGYILDGFPRTIFQAEALEKMTQIDAVVNFCITNEDVIERLSGRRTCPSNGNIYHLVFNPPKVDGKDDITGEDLIQREDDKPASILHRLEVYEKQTEPLIAYYRKKNLILDIKTNNKLTNEEILTNLKSLLDRKKNI